RSMSIDFLTPALFQDLLRVTVEIEKCRNASITLKQQVLRDNTVIAEAVTKMACISLSAMAPSAMPDELRARITSTDVAIA
ncbi:MAG: hypothetical protein HY308_01410, partial [Gammaproteobacteria bacterium]|nr:hypothetical protein [Gammaproteobacteria bacterium]